MDSRERIDTAIRMGKPDRVPVVPIIDFFAAAYGGISQKEMFFDVKKADLALEKTMRDLGRIDGQNLTYAGFGKALYFFFPTPPRIPGVDGVPESEGFQFVEKSVMTADEYRDVEAKGGMRWMLAKTVEGKPQYQGLSGAARLLYMLATEFPKLKMSMRRLRKMGVESLVGYNIAFTPMEFISLMLRSFNDFVLDLYRRPDDVLAASRSLMHTMQLQGLALCRLSGVKRVFIGGNRTSSVAHRAQAVREVRPARVGGDRRVLREARHHPGPAPGQRMDPLLPLFQGTAAAQVRPQPGRQLGHLQGQGGPG